MSGTLLVVGVYGALVLAISYITRSAKDADDYLMGGRKAPAVLVGAALFTLVGGGELVTLTALAFVHGLAALALFVGYALSFIFLAMLAQRIRAHPDMRQFLSLPDYIHSTFGKVAGHLVFLVSFAAFFAMLMIQFIAGGQILQPLLKLDYATCVMVTAGIAVAYLVIGGFRTVLATDLLQGLSRLLLLPMIIYAVVQDAKGGVQPVSTEPLPLAVWASLIITGFFAAASSADIWQRVYAAKSDKAASLGLVIGAVCIMVFGYFLVQLGLIARGTGLTKSADAAFVDALSVGLPDWATYLAIVLVLSTIMGTADTEIFLLAGMLGREASRVIGVMGTHEVAQKQSVKKSRWLVVAITAIAVALSLVFRELIPIYTWLLSAILVISPTVIGSLLVQASRALVVTSLVLNIAVFVALALGGFLAPEYAYLIVIPGFVLYGAAVISKNRQGDSIR
jgi:SSS family solute:Na+ symporter